MSRRPFLAILFALAARVHAQQQPPLKHLDWLGYDPSAPLDRGRGVVAFWHEPTADGAVDSLPIRQLPARGAPIAGYFLQRAQTDSSQYVLAARAGLVSNLLEFGYEIVGLPVDSIEPKAAWARTVYAFDAARRPQFGWVALNAGPARLVLWDSLLPTQDLFLADSLPWVFTDQPLGSPIPLPPPGNPGDYVLRPIATRGPWMQVKVVVPSDMCNDPQPNTKTVIGWVRYLNAAGRPRVWFHTRGC